MKILPYPLQRRDEFDPYHPRNLEIRYPSLARMYEASKRQFWNDTTVFDDLMKKHGKIRLSRKKREALRDILSIIYYGEIVAMHVSAQLLTMVRDLDAQKVLAAQVIEEAKHVTSMQKYILALNCGLPKINWFAKNVLEGLRHTKNPVLKLVGMQFLVENVAHHLFLNIRRSVEEPILQELLEYVDTDETKHVGLARNYLPQWLKRMGMLQVGRVVATQTWWVLNLMAATMQNKKNAAILGVDLNSGIKRAAREFTDLVESLGRWRDRKALFVMPAWVNDWLADTLFPSIEPPKSRAA